MIRELFGLRSLKIFRYRTALVLLINKFVKILLGDVVRRHGRAAAFLDYFVSPLMARHPRRVVEEGGQYKARRLSRLHAAEARTGAAARN